MWGHQGIILCWHRLGSELSRAEERWGSEWAQAARDGRRHWRHRRRRRGRQAAGVLAGARAGQAGLRGWGAGRGSNVRARRRRKAAERRRDSASRPPGNSNCGPAAGSHRLLRCVRPHQGRGRGLQLRGPGSPSSVRAGQAPRRCRHGLIATVDRQAAQACRQGGAARAERSAAPRAGAQRQRAGRRAAAASPAGLRMVVAQRSVVELAIGASVVSGRAQRGLQRVSTSPLQGWGAQGGENGGEIVGRRAGGAQQM